MAPNAAWLGLWETRWQLTMPLSAGEDCYRAADSQDNGAESGTRRVQLELEQLGAG